MPLTQLMRMLSKRDSTDRQAPYRAHSQAVEMEWVGQVVAEVTQEGRSPTRCLSSSSADSSAEAACNYSSGTSASAHQQRSSAAASGLMIGSVPSSSAVAAAAAPHVSARVLRARGKAALRGQDLDADLPEGTSSTPFVQQQQEQQHALFPVGSTGSSIIRLEPSNPQSIPAGLDYKRAATDPVSLWVATGSISSQRLHCIPTLNSAAADVDYDDDDDDDAPLASPMSPAQDVVHVKEHCEWEDGVVAGWLQDVDPSELMQCLHDDDEEQHELQQKQQPAGVSAGGGPQRTGSAMSATMVYSSSLYN